jgi:hypothetical protein
MRRQHGLTPLLVAAATAAALLPVLGNGFIWNWDDGLFFLRPEAPAVWGVSQGTFAPIPHLAYRLIRAVQGQAPLGFHLLSVLLHAANAAALCACLLELAPRPAAAAAAALLFGVHPLMVESVAWATSATDLMGAFFFLLAVLAWLRGGRRAALGLFVAAGLCRWKVFVLPVALVLLDFWRGEQRPWRGKWPFFAVAALVVLLGAASKSAVRPADAPPDGAPSAAAVASAAAVLPAKLVAPVGLVPVYVVEDGARAWLLLPLAACAFLGRGGLFACLFYLAALAPVLLYWRAPPVLMRDQYAYVSCLGFFAASAGLLARAFERRMAVLACAGLVLLLGTLSWRRARDWKDAETLWSAALEAQPDSPVFRYKLEEARLRR